MCGASNSLEELIGWRIVQGAAGAPLIPLGQTILLDSFPRRQHGTILSIYGMGNMIGPSLGPMFAGQIAETLGWRWGFWMVVPLAVASFIGSWAGAAEGRQGAGRRARLARLPEPVGGHRGGAARVLARPAARLVRELRDHHRNAGRGARALHFLRPQPHQRAPFHPAQASHRSQLQPRPDPGDAIRDAQLRNRRAAATAPAAARGLSGFRHRRHRRLPGTRLRHRLPAGDAHGAARSATSVSRSAPRCRPSRASG